MKIVKLLLIASCILASQSTQTRWPENLDNNAFYAYVKKTTTILDHVNEQLQFEHHGPHDILWTGQSYADALYPQQKAAFKRILKELKLNALISDNDKDKLLYEMVKYEVYNSWKRDFKNNYETSAKNNDVFAWAWLHQPVSIIIHE